MKKSIFTLMAYVLSLTVFSQKILTPGSSDIDVSYLKTSSSKYIIYYVKDNKWTPKGNYTKDLQIDGNTLKSTLNYIDDSSKWYRTRISTADYRSFTPISFISKSTTYSFNEQLGEQTTIKIHKLDNSEPDKEVKLDIKEKYIEYFMLEPLLMTLPLSIGYKVSIPTYYYNNRPDSIINSYIITEVKSYIHQSPKTAKHESWLVSVLEKSSNSTYYYIIDKKDHRLWQKEMYVGDGVWEICVNDELDYQPIKNKFNKEEALTKVQNGNSSIIGTAFARDHVKSKIPAVFNINKAQYAPKGTVVSILLNSPYIEEWKDVNKKIRKGKKLPEVPIDANVAACIKTTKVYDDNGHFEFTNLMPGEYILMTSFGYTHNYSYSYQSGTSYLMHPSGAVLGSNPVYSTASGSAGATADIEKIVTIDNDGDKVEVKLKDTM
ncbi:MAG: hypothetical protein PW786_14685 [Arachidicoccus sp.]|nr:hypothetical protein [Arachidicoccus sp.]